MGDSWLLIAVTAGEAWQSTVWQLGDALEYGKAGVLVPRFRARLLSGSRKVFSPLDKPSQKSPQVRFSARRRSCVRTTSRRCSFSSERAASLVRRRLTSLSRALA